MKGLVDIHCHILPGIDDGAKTIEQSINMLRQAYREGVRAIIATPHYHIGRTKSDGELCEKVLELLKDEADRMGMNMELYLGMEIYYYSEAMDMVKDNIIKTMASSRYVLIEYDPASDYQKIKQGTPKGSVEIKSINEEKYIYLKYRESDKIVSKYYGKYSENLELIEKIQKRKHVESMIKRITKEIKNIERIEKYVSLSWK